MKILDITGYLDGGTIRIITDEKKAYFIDNRLYTKTKGEVYESYPSDEGTTVPQSKVWEIISAVKEHTDVRYKDHVLKLLGTA